MIGESPRRPGYFQAQPEVLTPQATLPARSRDHVDGPMRLRQLWVAAEVADELAHLRDVGGFIAVGRAKSLAPDALRVGRQEIA